MKQESFQFGNRFNGRSALVDGDCFQEVLAAVPPALREKLLATSQLTLTSLTVMEEDVSEAVGLVMEHDLEDLAPMTEEQRDALNEYVTELFLLKDPLLDFSSTSDQLRDEIADFVDTIPNQIEAFLFDPATHILLAADSIEELRMADVGRLFDETPATNHAKLAAYLLAHRADFAGEIEAYQ